MSAKQDDAQKTARAMAALDAMTTIWAATFDIRQAVKAMMARPDGEDRLIAFIKQGHAEGLYAGHTSHQPAIQSAELAALLKDGNQYCRILSLLGMEEEGDPVAEVAALKMENEGFKLRLMSAEGGAQEAAKAEVMYRDAERYRLAAEHLVLAGGSAKFGWPIAPACKAEWDRYLDAAIAQAVQP